MLQSYKLFWQKAGDAEYYRYLCTSTIYNHNIKYHIIMSKVTVVGAGNVGATCANVLVTQQIADEVVLIDIKPGFAEGKAMDIMQTANILHLSTRLTGVTNDYEKTAGSDMVVITSGIPRKPGMTREELIGVNAGIVKSVTENVLKYSPNAIILCVANPMDTMTYLIHKISGLPKNRIIGMGGALDSARFKYYLSLALEANATEVEGIVIGGHGDTTMIPLKRFAAYRGIPASSLIPAEQLDKVAADTMVGGATLTSLLGTSAWIAPGAAAAQCVAAVLGDQKRLISCSALLEGEYGEKDLCIGVPCILGRDGIEKIVDFNLNDEELALFHKSAEAVHKTNAALPC
jgi:malate dehydrogenase